MQNKKFENIEERVNFDIVRYANCWEDADVLLEALKVKENGVYLSIASGGDNSFSILAKKPAKVIAIDVSYAQLACVELKKAAFLHLPYDKLLGFLGVNNCNEREVIYSKIRKSISMRAKEFWDNHPEYIRKGIIHIGKFEKYFGLFRRWVLPIIHNRKTVYQLLSKCNEVERIKFYNEKWNNLRWRMLFKIFFSRKVMGIFGRDPEFFKYVETDVANDIFKRAEYALTVLPTNNNPYLEYILTGNFKRSLPFYLRRENYDLIRSNLEKLIIFKGDLQSAIEYYCKVKFDGFNLSDIFEYMSYKQYIMHLKNILNSSKSGSRIVYWNMLVDRKYDGEFEDKIKFFDEEAEKLHSRDKAFFYKALIIGEVQ